jgi:hypothetical protein
LTVWVFACDEHEDHPELTSDEDRDPDNEKRQQIRVTSAVGEIQREYNNNADDGC